MQIIPLTVGVLADDAGGPAERERRSTPLFFLGVIS
jgi:hypothetical protein